MSLTGLPRENDDAVSPVIGVILMVAITVVLAAVIFVMVSNLGDSPKSPPSITFIKHDGGDRATVVVADSGFVRSDFEIRLSEAGDFAFGAIPPGPDDLIQDTFVPLGGSESVSGGDSIYLCSTTASTAVIFSVRHIESNSMIFETMFANLPACPA